MGCWSQLVNCLSAGCKQIAKLLSEVTQKGVPWGRCIHDEHVVRKAENGRPKLDRRHSSEVVIGYYALSFAALMFPRKPP